MSAVPRNCIVRSPIARNLRMIGGHPMAGNEHKGEKGWNSQFFRNAPFFLCPAGIAVHAADRRK